MALPAGVFTLGVFLTGLARNLSHQQLRLDRDYEKHLEEFRSILKLAKSLGYEELARTIAPTQIVMDKSELQVEVLLSETREKEFSLSIRPLNLGFTRKYKYSNFVQNSLWVEVRSVPLPPGRPKASPV
jgi:hypothetical protein